MLKRLAIFLLICSAVYAQDELQKFQETIQTICEKATKAFVFVGGGSGVLISSDGYILTNYHVADTRTDNMSVYLPDGSKYESKKISQDALGDLLLLKIEAPDRKFNYLELADTDKLEVGDYVIAIGNPFNLAASSPDKKYHPSTSLGIVSALHRYQGSYFDCIQTDAALNPGNSGGPLVDLDGRIVGINGRISPRYQTRVNSGVGYAVSANFIKKFLPHMMKGEDIKHGYIKGLDLHPDHTDGKGAKVARVQNDTPAETAGIKPGDIITKIDDLPVRSRFSLYSILGGYLANQEVTLTILRSGEEKELKIKLDIFDYNEILGSQRPRGSGYAGIMVIDTPDGVALQIVSPDSPAERAGLQMGDIITKFDDKEVKTSQEFLNILWMHKPGQKIKLSIRREAEEFDVELTLERHPMD